MLTKINISYSFSHVAAIIPPETTLSAPGGNMNITYSIGITVHTTVA